MKTIKFEGKQYDVEDWVKWVARNEDGTVLAFEFRPIYGIYNWDSLEGRCEDITIKWQDSLTEV